MAKSSIIRYKENVDNVLRLLREGRELIVFDVETTGLKALTSKIVSCSAVKYKYVNGRFEEVDRLNQFINPIVPIPEEAANVHGITEDMIKDCPNEWEAFEETIRPFFGDNPVVGGYNIEKFDNKFLKHLWLKCSGIPFEPDGVIDVLRMVQEKMNLKNSTLENAAKELGADKGIQFHSSLDDVVVTQRVMESLIPMYYEAKKPSMFRYQILDASYKSYSHKNERIYIETYPFSKIYLDVYNKKWENNDVEGFSFEELEEDVLKFFGHKDIKAFIADMRERGSQ